MKQTKTFMKERGRKGGIYLIPNLLTTGNLFSGLFSILAVFNANYVAASAESSLSEAAQSASTSSRDPQQIGFSATVSNPARRNPLVSRAVKKVFPTAVSVPVMK
jgi:hypothetical protein